MITVRLIGLNKIKIAVRGWNRDFKATGPEVKRLLRSVGRGGRDIAKKQITTQGNGTWQKISKWTRARTGRRKALTTERSRITFRLKPRRSEVVYAERSDSWNLTQHHKGFTSSGFSNKKITIPLRNPAALKFKGSAITIRSAKPSVVPARNVWGTLAQHQSMAQVEGFKWMSRIVSKRVGK